MTITQEKINQAVEGLRDEALSLLQDLVRIPTLPGSENGVQEVIAARMKAMGLELDIWDPVDPELQAHQGICSFGDSLYRQTQRGRNLEGGWRREKADLQWACGCGPHRRRRQMEPFSLERGFRGRKSIRTRIGGYESRLRG